MPQVVPENPAADRPEISEAGWNDSRLVRECLRGNDQAWSALVDKYKNLVFSIALRKGLSREDAADLFQSVWIQVYSKLSTLRKKGSIRSWLISVTSNACYHWQQKQFKTAFREGQELERVEGDQRHAVEPEDIELQERELLVQRAIAELSPRCQELIRLLFYTEPPLPYRQVAAKLGLAIGSIGFIRGRCLKKLHYLLEKQGLE